ncbi:MAG TPA: hypothetical protein VNZ57_12680 [Longimicrobiales bacterium]|nr:hypothetical protein [Longimicrobiales bacterium]
MSTQSPRPNQNAAASGPTPLVALLTLTFFGSLGTGILWSGVAFIAKHDFDYSVERSLVLYTIAALAYIAGAFGSASVTRAAARFVSTRGLVALIFLCQALVCALPLAFRGEWVIWIISLGVSVFGSLIWPIVESYLTAGRHDADMRSAIGWFNVTWMSAVSLALIAMAPVIEQRAALALVALVPASLLAIVALPWFGRAPGQHEPATWQASITSEYPMLLGSARALLPAGYLLIGALSPLMPFRVEEVGASPVVETPATATWMVARVLAITVLWRLPFWHGRWSVLLVGGIGLAAGFAMIVAAPGMATLLVGLAIFGAAQGVVYYAALYYAMAVGAAAVEAGGTHEGLIGIGYAVGPLAALAGIAGPQLIGLGIGPDSGIVIAVFAILAVVGGLALRPYRLALRHRSAASGG